MFACEEKIAFVTGALGVIGRAYTKHLLQNKVKGVALIDVQENDVAYQQQLNETYGSNKCIYIKTDVTNTSELREAFEKTVQHFKQLDIVINNAGIINEKNYALCLQLNFMATFNGSMMALREYLPKYKKGSGVIVNTSSIAGVVPYKLPIYSISKHAVASIGICFKNEDECLKQDIRVLTICPGPTPSPVLTEALDIFSTEAKSSKEINIAASTDAEYLGDGLIQIMKEGTNGAVWMFMTGKEPHEMDYSAVFDVAWDYILK